MPSLVLHRESHYLGFGERQPAVPTKNLILLMNIEVSSVDCQLFIARLNILRYQTLPSLLLSSVLSRSLIASVSLPKAEI